MNLLSDADDETERILEWVKQRGAARRRRKGLLGSVATLSAVGVTLVLLLPGASTGPASPPAVAVPAATAQVAPDWQLATYITGAPWQQAQVSGPPAGSLTCPTSTTCFAVANPATAPVGSTLELESQGALDVSVDGGHHWRALPLPAATDFTTPLVCATADRCVVGAVVFQPASSSAAGSSSAQAQAAARASRQGYSVGSKALATYSASDITNKLLMTSDGGKHWTSSRLPSAFGPLVDLVCSGSRCAGLSWNTGEAVPNGELPFPVNEATPFTQSVAPSSFVTTDDGGKTWSRHATPSGDQLGELTCPTTTECIAVGIAGIGESARGVVTVTHDRGKSWVAPSLSGILLSRSTSVSCPSRNTCYLAGTAGKYVTQRLVGNPDRTRASTPVKPQQIFRETGGVVLRSTDGGATWRKLTLPSALANAELSSVSCSTALSCSIGGSLATGLGFGGPGDGTITGVDGNGHQFAGSDGPAVVVSTASAGQHWTVKTFSWHEPTGAAFLRVEEVECRSAGSCVALGYAVATVGASARRLGQLGPKVEVPVLTSVPK